MKRVVKGLSAMSLLGLVVVVALLAPVVQPAAASNVDVNVGKVLVLGGTPGTYISIWRASGGVPADSAGQPIGNMESVTPVSSSGETEVFVPWGQASNVFIWNPSKGYTFLQTVAPNDRGDVVTLTAK
jgi:hypothetical protein